MNMTVLLTKIKTFWGKIEDWFIRNSKWLIYILIVLVSTTIAHSLFKGDNNLPLPQTIVQYKEVEKWKDKYDQEHSTLIQTRLDQASFKRIVEDSIAKLLKVKPEDIASVTSITTKGEIEIEPKTEYVDTSKTYLFADSTNYYAIKGFLDTRINKTKLTLNTYDTFNIVPYKKRSFFKETYKVDVTNANPYNHVVSGYSYSKEENIKRFGIGPQVGYDPINKRVTYGIGIQYNIIRF